VPSASSESPTPPTSDSLARVLSFVRESIANTADGVLPIDAGLVVSTPSLPAVCALNHVRSRRSLS
jgi:hypothetical protein